MSVADDGRDAHERLDVALDVSEGSGGLSKQAQNELSEIKRLVLGIQGEAGGLSALDRRQTTDNLPTGPWQELYTDQLGYMGVYRDGGSPQWGSRGHCHAVLAGLINQALHYPGSKVNFLRLTEVVTSYNGEQGAGDERAFKEGVLTVYRRAGAKTDEQILAMAAGVGRQALLEALALLENQSSTVALTVIKGLPPGKNLCGWVRKLVVQYDKVVLVVLPGKISYDGIVGMLRASLPDAAAKIETYQYPARGQPSLKAIFGKLAGKSPSLGKGGSVDVLADVGELERFQAELHVAGGMPFDTSAVRVVPAEIPMDSDTQIFGALRADDRQKLQHLLDPQVFSDPARIDIFRRATNEGKNLAEPRYSHLGDELDVIIDSAEEGDVRMTHQLFRQWQSRLLRDMDEHAGIWVDYFGQNAKRWSDPPGMLDVGYAGAADVPFLRSEIHANFDHAMNWVAYNDQLGWPDRQPVKAREQRRRAIDNLLQSTALDLLHIIALANDEETNKPSKSSDDDGIDGQEVNEVGILSAPQSYTPGGVGGMITRGNQSSAWAGGRAVLARPSDHVPEDDEEDEYGNSIDNGRSGVNLGGGLQR